MESDLSAGLSRSCCGVELRLALGWLSLACRPSDQGRQPDVLCSGCASEGEALGTPREPQRPGRLSGLEWSLRAPDTMGRDLGAWTEGARADSAPEASDVWRCPCSRRSWASSSVRCCCDGGPDRAHRAGRTRPEEYARILWSERRRQARGRRSSRLGRVGASAVGSGRGCGTKREGNTGSDQQRSQEGSR